MEVRTCIRCPATFEPLERMPNQKLCHACAMDAILNACAESVAEMSDEEIEAELREDGVDVEAFKARVSESFQRLQDKIKASGK